MMALEKTLYGEDLFDELQREDENENIEFKINNKMKDLIKGLEEIVKTPYPEYNRSIDSVKWNTEEIIYEKCLALIPSPENYNSQNIKELIIYLKSKEKEYLNRHDRKGNPEKVGLYINALINNCNNQTINLPTKLLRLRIDHLGYRNNGKLIRIDGGAGNCIGQEMTTGKIIVNGNAYDHLGIRMSGGTIKTKEAGWRAGQEMTGGEIYIFGERSWVDKLGPVSNAGADLGYCMQGGLLYVEGNVTGYGFGAGMKNGSIYVLGDVRSDSFGRRMKGGQIKIDGSVQGRELGLAMKGGKIYISGNLTGGAVGEDMTAGEIRINGKSFPTSKKILGGNIYHKGKLIVKDGRRIE